MAAKHIFFTAFPAWGHARSFCILAARLVKEDPDLIFTLLLAPTLLSKAQDEVEAELRDDGTEERQKRIRILSSFQMTSGDPFAAIEQSIATYADVYKAIYAGQQVTCAIKGTVFDAISAPSVIVMDFFTYAQMTITRSISGNTIPIMAWLTGGAGATLRLFGPEHLGGFDFVNKIKDEAAKLGVSPKEVGDKIYAECTGKIVKLPGTPEMYDYEFFPQKLAFEIPVTELFMASYAFLEECDAVFAVNSFALEKDAMDAMKLWFAGWNKEVYTIGPLLPSGYGTLQQSNRGATDIQNFLERMLAKNGKNSVVLISFGTTFWPSDTTYIEEVVEAMIDTEFPFILSHASPFAKFSDEFKKKIESSGIGFLTTWCPQQYILEHPATGWFLTHCGYNSVTESIGSGIPMIAWPFAADQPEGAYHLAHSGLAIELLEVRTGEHASKPLRRNGKGAAGTREAVGREIRDVIATCRGDKGKQIRENVQKVRAEFLSAWDSEGPSRKEFNKFLENFTKKVA